MNATPSSAASATNSPTARSIWNHEKFRKEATSAAANYATATPFPHAVFDDMLVAGPEILESFPDPEWTGWTALGDSYQLHKFSCSNIERIPEPFARLIHELSAPGFLRVLQDLTGIRNLLPDPYLAGGGLHLSGPGGVLAPHTDFHLYQPFGLYRRVNVLIYLNEEWDSSYGGCLELGDVRATPKVVVPNWGSVMVFTTDDRSVHGFPKPIVEGRWRRSIALYYYTTDEAREFQGDTATYWRAHGEQEGAVRKARLALYKSLNTVSRGVSLLAHLANPNQGMGWWRTRQERVAKEEADRA